MNEDHRGALLRIAADIDRLQSESLDLGEEMLAFLLSHAKEEIRLQLSKGGSGENDTR